MTNSSTTRITTPVEASHQRSFTRRWGKRYRCAQCYALGIERPPHFMCHHCGRLFCEDCSPRLNTPWSWFFQHQELSALRARGARGWVGDRWWPEAAHCREHVHYVPRYTSWVLVMIMLALLAIPLLTAVGIGAGWTVVIPALLFVLGVGIAYMWRTWDATSRQERFFPVDGEPPTIEIEEQIEADALLEGGIYRETLHERSPRGVLRAKVRVTEEDRRQLEQYERFHHLTETTMSGLPVTAGAVVVENVGRIVHNDMRWNERGEWLTHPDIPSWNGQRSRRWQFQDKLARWAALWVPGSNEPKIFAFDYLIDWWVWRQTYKMPFPIQIRAAFPEQGERRSVVLEIVLTGSVAHLTNPYISRILLERSEGLPEFRLLPVQGQKMEGDSTDRIVVQDLKLNEQRVGTIHVQFKEPIKPNQSAWLAGTVVMGAVGSTLSQMEVKAYFDAFGKLSQPARREIRSAAVLNYRLNLATLPYQTRTIATDQATVAGVDAERDDLLIERLERESKVVSVTEQVQPIPLNAPEKVAMPPIRDIFGRWRDSTLAIPMTYHVKLTPTPAGTNVKIEVEQSDDGDPERAAAPGRAVNAIRKLLLAPLPKKPAPEPKLLGKLRAK